MSTFTISILATIDPVIRSSLSFQLATDSPDTVVVAHDVDADSVSHVASGSCGVVEETSHPLAHSCLSCAVREDVIPTLVRMREEGCWSHAVVALPVTADPAPLLRSLTVELVRGGALEGSQFGATIAVLDADALVDDAFSDDLLADRGIDLGDDDDRVVAEAVGPIVAVADVVLLTADDAPSPDARALADHLRGEGSAVAVAQLGEIDPVDLLRRTGRPSDSLERVSPTHRSRRSVSDSCGIWTLTLDSPHPFHPGRLRANMRRLADHQVQARGHFWVASRPHGLCVWESAGRQLRVGEHGPWPSTKRRTHLRITGMHGDRSMIAQAFADSLVRPGEDLGEQLDTLDDWFPQD
ncbi:GTP-binding protein [Demequina sp. NBRC 110052]|uniref:CobW family GTP-binding protein n=1 Tax=Demequina sp. NBRC 110052 TaxID=1570341 RepID=UPI000A00CBB9|nr:GTP-binding protein [Demequina sp. NBRC 110052]